MPLSFASKVICKQPGRYIAWPTVVSAPNGTLYAVFSGDRDSHVCPFGKVFLIRSDDGGLNWTPPKVIVNTPLDDRDAGICICPDGTLVVSWFTSHYADYRPQYEEFYRKNGNPDDDGWLRWCDQLAGISPEVIRQWAPSYESPDLPDVSKRWLGFWTIRSRDGGSSWDQPRLSPVCAPHGPNVMANGDLIFVGARFSHPADGSGSIAAARSRDQGQKWEVLASIPGFPPYPGPVKGGWSRLVETHVVQAASGKLVAMARYEETTSPSHPYRSHLWQFESEDEGLTWTSPRQTEIIGKPPFVLRLKDGRLITTYSFRYQPYSVRARISADEGKSWNAEEEIVLGDDKQTHDERTSLDLGYPSVAQLPNGSLFFVYYMIDQPGEVPSLMASCIT